MFRLTNRRPAVREAEPPDPGTEVTRLDGAQRATFAAGCFWGVEAAFREIDGVVRTRVGYTGGLTRDPTYNQVRDQATHHAEAVEIWFDPAKVTYRQLLDTFWRLHESTTRNRQGSDLAFHLRSAIFFHDPAQEALAIASRDGEQHHLSKPIVTEITPAATFYDAEEHHQRYFEKQDASRDSRRARLSSFKRFWAGVDRRDPKPAARMS